MARILTIDDDRFIRQLLKAQLTEHGHEVLEADTGDGGLAMARTELPDVILLDLGLPGMHGTVVLDELKIAGTETAGIPVIIVSAWGEGHALNTALARGAQSVLRKPFAAIDLYALVEDALRSRMRA